MLTRVMAGEIKWIVLAFIISLVLVSGANTSFLTDVNTDMNHAYSGLNFYMEVLFFFVFSTFVVFGIKGFFEMYSQKTANFIIFITGIALTIAVFVLTYQILF